MNFRDEFLKNSCFLPGHYYSPIISTDEIRKREYEVWPEKIESTIEGISLNPENQIKLVRSFQTFYDEMPFTEIKTVNCRYYFKNELYSYTDAIFLYSMIRQFKPKRIIEIGSGFSSAVMMDTNMLFFDNQIKITFIEPYSERLRSLMYENDLKNNELIESQLQVVPITIFEKLNDGDVLFVDSSHVIKTGSDLHEIFFKIIPSLKSGVLIHFHDVFYPFEYPKDWVLEGRNWNEDYFLRAFLMYNESFEIKLFSDYLHSFHPEIFTNMPLSYKNWGGNLWLQKR